MSGQSDRRQPIKAVLFDKDGTLIDFRKTWLAAYRGAAAVIASPEGSPRRFTKSKHYKHRNH